MTARGQARNRAATAANSRAATAAYSGAATAAYSRAATAAYSRAATAALASLLVAAAACVVSPAGAQLLTDAPGPAAEVGIDPPDDARLPFDLRFTDSHGQTVVLGDYFDGERPVIFTIVYYRCPMLCGLLLNGLTDALQEVEFTVGDEFEIVTISMDPRETWNLGAAKKRSYLEEYGRPGAESGWHFHVGDEEAVHAAAESMGFRYVFDEKTDQYAHATGLFVLTPDGRLSRFLSGVVFEPKTVRLALVEASEGKVGTTFDRFLMTCFHYDPKDGRYSLAAMTVVRAGGAVTLVLLAGGIALFSRRAARRRNAGDGTPGPGATGAGEDAP